MTSRIAKMKNLFLRQSYLDSWENYQQSLKPHAFTNWDYLILTASNEEQAKIYRKQIEYRLELGLLPSNVKYVVLPDPQGKRVGSGGATFNVLKYIAEENNSMDNPFAGKRILVIHSGGDSKRVPQYSVLGKLFSPVPRQLPNGRPSTLFDEFVIGMSQVPGRLQEGMLVLSGDVLLLFNSLQIDFCFNGAAAISMKEDVETGKDHGVFLNNGKDYVSRFLHKQSEEQLRKLGAVNDRNCVDLDTGAVVFDTQVLMSLFSLISTDRKNDAVKFDKFVNEKARISFYGDFLYPLAEESTLDDYYQEAAEGSICEELLDCRKQIWHALHSYGMKMICLSPAEFIHFGTTQELLQLVTENICDYEFLDWKKQVCTNFIPDRFPVMDSESAPEFNSDFAIHNSFVDASAKIGKGAYLEKSYVGRNVVIGEGSILSTVRIEDATVPENVVLHGLKLQSGNYVVRIYGVNDNPKGKTKQKTSFLCTTLDKFMDILKTHNFREEDFWDKPDTCLWDAKLYPVCENEKEALEAALLVYKIAAEEASGDQITSYLKSNRASLYESFNQADVTAMLPWEIELEGEILCNRFIQKLEEEQHYVEALKVFGTAHISDRQYMILMNKAEMAPFSSKIRIYYALAQYFKNKEYLPSATKGEELEAKCFETIRKVIYEDGRRNIVNCENYRIRKSEVKVELPVRVNWGGGWTDTPPYCIEKGGTVLNAAIKLNGIYPVQVTVRKLDSYKVEFESTDIGVKTDIFNLNEIQDCHNPYDYFALHKAALIACGIIPIEGGEPLEKLLENIGGGIYLSTQVVGIPKGSGLGTSSILAAACVKGLFEFLGETLPDNSLYEIVMCMEQIMSTGGGWQDQVGGLSPGVKFITTKSGLRQEIQVETLNLSGETKEELQKRFALIYTGQRRLARNLLREVVGNYIGQRPESIEALHQIQRVAALMKFELEKGNIDELARLFNRHWELSIKLDSGSTNTCIDQIFMSCEDLIDGRFIAGAGGGGFLQVILKKGVTKEKLKLRLKEVFQDSGVDVWECQFV